MISAILHRHGSSVIKGSTVIAVTKLALWAQKHYIQRLCKSYECSTSRWQLPIRLAFELNVRTKDTAVMMADPRVISILDVEICKILPAIIDSPFRTSEGIAFTFYLRLQSLSPAITCADYSISTSAQRARLRCRLVAHSARMSFGC